MVMNKKSKGSNAERELLHFFWDNGWAAMRAAGSGSTTRPSPDILAGNGSRKLAIECKVTQNVRQYLTKKEILELGEFSRLFGAEAWIGVKFNNVDWYFMNIEDLKDTGAGHAVSIELAKRKGLLFSELIKGF